MGALILGSVFMVNAQNYSSNNYTIITPHMYSGIYATSSSFKVYGVLSQPGLGTSTSASFGAKPGFLYFPFVVTPVVSATAGDTQVDLTWTSASVGAEFSIGSYHVGRSTTSGGPYTFTDVGTVLGTTTTGLLNGTAYYFVIRVHDSLGNAVATSSQVSAQPAPPSGGGGNPPPEQSTTRVNFTGRAYPGSIVNVLKDAQVASSIIAAQDGNFTIELSGLNAGSYVFSLYTEDNKGLRSATLAFPTNVTNGVTTYVSGIFLSPTIDVDKIQVKKGNEITIFGQSLPNSQITISVGSETEHFVTVTSDSYGVYLHKFNTSDLEFGQYSVRSKAAIGNEISGYSQSVSFAVGESDIFKVKPTFMKGDLNDDKKVNLIDFSIAAYWYKRSLIGEILEKEKERLNGDGKINLIDFSIIAYYWTG